MALSRFLLVLCFSVSTLAVSAVNSDGQALLSLVRHWTIVPSLVQLSWNGSDSYPCSWVGVYCDQKNQSVVVLSLSGYQISGQLGPEIAQLKYLKSIDFSNNSFTGGIPSTLGNLAKLISVDLSMNKFSGPIPPELGRLVDLQALNLSRNSFRGELPSQVSNCNKLLHLDISNNLLNGSIPTSLRSLIQLSTLSLSENGFTGDIPAFFFGFSKLSKLELGGNTLSGNITLAFGFLGAVQNLILLNLSSNRLTGEIPIEMRKFNMLEHLDLSCNNLSGSLRVLADIPSLVFINVSYNHFSCPIPSPLHRFLNSSATSFAGNSGLCLPLGDLNCTGNRKSENKRGRQRANITIIVIGSSFLLGILIVYIRLRRKCASQKRLQRKGSEELPNIIRGENGGSSLFNAIMKATEDLDPRYIIGSGGQGTVYKVVLYERVYAVKKHSFNEFKGTSHSMTRELRTIGKVRHRNLNSLEGFCLGYNYGLISYAYMEKGSLHDVLHGTKTNLPEPLTWKSRFNIALGTAQGLSYLHYDCHPPIIHGDIKAKNILLDSDLEPHISDFGLAMFLDQAGASRQSTKICGTIGYIAPENAFRTRKSKESDVYSYGVVLLELITRKKAVDPSFNGEHDIVSWVRSVSSWPRIQELGRVVDPTLVYELVDYSVKEQVSSVLFLALECTQQDWRRRPSMRDIVNWLTWIHGHRATTGLDFAELMDFDGLD